MTKFKFLTHRLQRLQFLDGQFFFLFFCFSCLLLSSHETQALIRFEDATYPELATNGRALAIGNAFICKVDDSSSVFYNPAGLGTVRWTHFHLTNIHLETNKGLLDAGAGGNVTQISKDATKGFSTDGSRQLLLQHRGKMTHNRFNIMPNFTARYISFGYLYSNQKRATIGEHEDALFEFAEREDKGPYLALNISLFGGVIKFGGTMIYLRRKEIIDERDRNEEVNLEKGDYKRGRAPIGVGGVRVTLPIVFLPTFAATFHNALGKEFTPESSGGAPTAIARAVDVGFSITPQIGKVFRVHLEYNFKDVGNRYQDVDKKRKNVFGIEFDFARKMFVRFGYADGYGSAGVGIKSRRLEFDLTTYAVDTSSTQYRGEEDRRFALTLSSGI